VAHVTLLNNLALPARQAIVRAGSLATEFGQRRLGDGVLLLALAEGEPSASPVPLRVAASVIRADIEARAPRSRDRALLATLGIDLDQVRGHTRAATARLADAGGWGLRRSLLRPLRVTLHGPGATIVLDASGRKVLEVARWVSRRGSRSAIEREDLLWGLLADGSSESVRILHRCRVDLRGLWTDLQRWQQSG
jgi:hypothetical protein